MFYPLIGYDERVQYKTYSLYLLQFVKLVYVNVY